MAGRLSTTVVALACAALAGCTATLHGHQSTAGGATTTTTSSATAGSASVGGARVAFSSGQPASASAPGGHVALGKGASAALLVGLFVANLLHHAAGEPAVKPLPPGTTIADTCSCYQKPVSSER
jgi:hypothetical protein